MLPPQIVAFFAVTKQPVSGLVRLPDGRVAYYDRNNGMMYGQQKIDTNWFYFNTVNGGREGGEKYLSKRWYFFKLTTGIRAKGFAQLPDGRYCYYTEGGMQYGHQKVGANWYYFNTVTGNREGGERYLNKRWYFYNLTTGVRAKGFAQLPDGRYCYYTDTGMQYGQQKVGGNWYYFNTVTGNREGGEKNIGGKWWFFNLTTGVRATGITKLPDSRTVYYDANNGMIYGWHKLGAVVYQFNPVNGNVEVILDPNKVSVGIDVSSFQGYINWALIKSTGAIQFAFIRGADWNNSINGYSVDSRFIENVRGAQAQGIKVGTYIFCYSYTQDSLRRGIDVIDTALRNNGLNLQLPFIIDFEWNGNITHNTYAQRTNLLRQGMQYIQSKGYQTGFYSSLNWARNYYDATSLENEGYTFWLAHWTGPSTGPSASHGWTRTPSFWQYTSDGTVAGINGRVDMNYSYNGKYI